MKSDQYLISIPLDRGEIRLPCESMAILQLYARQLNGDGFVGSKSMLNFLIANPALLVSALCSMKTLDHVRLKDLQRWTRGFDGFPTLNPTKKGTPTNAVKKLQRRIARSATSQQFWKAIKRFVVGQNKSDSEVKLKTRRLPKLSKGLLKAVCKSAATRVNQSDKATCCIDLPQLLIRLQETQKIQSDFEGELLRQKLDSMRLLAYGASHEINNPLANVATRAQSLLQSESDPSRRHRLAVIYEQAMRAHEMISDMMLFAHPPQVELKSMDLTECVRSVADELSKGWQSLGIQCEIVGSTTLIVGDETKLADAVKSLLTNSMEAIGSDGLVKVEVNSDDSEGVCLSISDSGPAIDPEISDNIFDPFFSGREAGRGLGFGLSKAWRIAQMHGATIERGVSELGGAQFTIRFLKRLDPQSKVIQQSLAAA